MVASAASASLPAVGSLVQARGRDWVVLPSVEEGIVRLRPLTGSDDDAIGVFVPLEGTPQQGTFPPNSVSSTYAPTAYSVSTGMMGAPAWKAPRRRCASKRQPCGPKSRQS